MTRAPEWAGPVGDAWAQEWRRTDRMFAGVAAPLDAAILEAAPRAPGVAIDIGCGAGSTSLALAGARPDIAVTGFDVSPDLVAVATERAAAVGNCTFVALDLNDTAPIAAGHTIDLFFSRHGVMFFDDPAAAFARLHAAARPGAPLVFSCFRAASLNPWASSVVAELTGTMPPAPEGYAPGPFGFADPDVPTAFLAAAGWRDLDRRSLDFTYIAGAGADPVGEAVALLRRIGPVASAIRDAADPSATVDRLATLLERYRTGDTIAFPAAAWLWRATA